jgi:hypothetical protein
VYFKSSKNGRVSIKTGQFALCSLSLMHKNCVAMQKKTLCFYLRATNAVAHVTH